MAVDRRRCLPRGGAVQLGDLARDLAGHAAIGVDTSPFIHLLERHPRFYEPACELFNHLTKPGVKGVTSIITLIEACVHPKRIGRDDLVQAYEKGAPPLAAGTDGVSRCRRRPEGSGSPRAVRYSGARRPPDCRRSGGWGHRLRNQRQAIGEGAGHPGLGNRQLRGLIRGTGQWACIPRRADRLAVAHTCTHTSPPP